MEIVKYNKYKKGNVSSFGSSGSNSSNSSNTSTGSSTTLSRSIWGNEDTGNDISNSMLINGNIYLQGFDADSELDDDNDSKEKEESEVFPPDDANLDGSIYASGGFFGKNLEITNDAYIKNHLYVNHSHSEHKGDKVCLIEEVETNKNNIETNKNNIASNLSEINALKTRVSTNETNIANNATAIDSLDVNLQIAEQSIKNNADEIVLLKNRTTVNETAIANFLPIGSIIMFSGTMAEIPEGWAICNGENGTPNLIGKFIKAWTSSGQTGGSNSIKLEEAHIPKLPVKLDNDLFDTFKGTAQYDRLEKNIPALDEVGEYVFDKGGSTHYTIYTGYNEKDKGLIGVPYKTILNDVQQFTYAGRKSDVQQDINIEPSYYTLIYICKIA